MKKVLSFMLTLALLLPFCGGFSLSNAADTPAGTAISTVQEFINMDPSGVYYLANDIDFSGTTYTRNVYTKTFKGVLDGNGYALLGITVTASNSDAGIFATSFGGTLRNLTIGAEDAPVSVTSSGAGYSVAAVAGTVASGALFENVTIYANVTAEGKTAGFTCYMPNGKMTISGCKVYGSISGNPASGFVAMSADGSSEISITNSENHATVTGANLGAGGFYANQSTVSGSRVCHLTIVGCVNYGAITASDWRAGGIVGEFTEEKSSTLTVEYCYNLAPVTMTGSGGFAAGIVGGMSFDPPTGARKVSNVYNAGMIRNTANNTRAFGIAFANGASDLVTIENAAYMDGTASQNCKETNVSLISDKDALLSAVRSFPAGEDGLSYMADTGNINEGFPILAWQNTTHSNIKTYSCGRKVCLDCGIVLSLSEDEKHSYTKTATAPEGYLDGYITSVCKHCSDTVIKADQPNQWQVKPVDGVYVLTRAEHLMWFAANVNAGLLGGSESVCLDADLDMTGLAFDPIAADGKVFLGKFDGNGHTISNLTVNTEGDAGLIGKAGLGSEIKNVALSNAKIQGGGYAGALVGSVASGSVVKIENIAVVDSSVTSSAKAAGGLIGSSEGAVDVSVLCAVCDTVTVNGTDAGGVLGNGNSAQLRNVYANATVSANGGKTGVLAVSTATISVTFCGYSKSTSGTQKNGIEYAEEAFSNGEIAYLINTYGARKVFGVEGGRTTLSGTAVRMIRLGSKKVYTTNTLAAGEGTAVYVLPDEGGMMLAIVQVQNADERLVDSTITVGGKEIAFKDLTLSKYVASGDDYYVVAEGCVLYTVQIEGTATPSVVIGSSFNGTAATVTE